VVPTAGRGGGMMLAPPTRYLPEGHKIVERFRTAPGDPRKGDINCVPRVAGELTFPAEYGGTYVLRPPKPASDSDGRVGGDDGGGLLMRKDDATAAATPHLTS
jgi:hypothetical protein